MLIANSVSKYRSIKYVQHYFIQAPNNASGSQPSTSSVVTNSEEVLSDIDDDDDDDELDLDELNELEASLSRTSIQIREPGQAIVS